MRFYFEDRVGGNVATKCLRVCSNSSTREVIETLSEKFRPDMKMLTTSYSLYEIHANKGNHSTHTVYCRRGHVIIICLELKQQYNHQNRKSTFHAKQFADFSLSNMKSPALLYHLIEYFGSLY